MTTQFVKSLSVIDKYAKELKPPEVRELNLVNLTLNEIRVYLGFLDIIFDRYLETGIEWQKVSKELQTSLQGKEGTMSDEQMTLFNRSGELSSRMRLEIESFFLFCHIFLNKMTNYPQMYFSHNYKRGITCGSHHKFWNSVNNKHYFDPINEELKEKAEWLQEKVIGHRDHLITHTLEKEQDARMLIKGLSFYQEGKGFSTMSTTLYPDEKVNGQTNSVPIEEIIPNIERYTELFFEFLEQNKDKSIFAQET
ncbi:MAG: hypothetical protein WCQ32_01390 [bacterium]